MAFSFRSLRHVSPLFLVLLGGAALATDGTATENLIPNGDFAQGNKGFKSELPYVKPENNCLWEGKYTVAAVFNDPLLHRLIAPEPFTAANRKTRKEQVLFANAGGVDPLVLWSAKVKCAPHTQYCLTFYAMSMTGYVMDGNPPHQVATEEWVPDFEISANDQAGPEAPAGLGKWSRGVLFWNSGDLTSTTVKITRTKFPHGGGLVALCDIEMVPAKDGSATSGH